MASTHPAPSTSRPMLHPIPSLSSLPSLPALSLPSPSSFSPTHATPSPSHTPSSSAASVSAPSASLSRQRGSRGRFISRVHSTPTTPSPQPRRCAACGTTTTSQWRSGKDGVSLCNADGIRAARAARAAAANAKRRPRHSPAAPLGDLLDGYRTRAYDRNALAVGSADTDVQSTGRPGGRCDSPNTSYASHLSIGMSETGSDILSDGGYAKRYRAQAGANMLPPPCAPSIFDGEKVSGTSRLNRPSLFVNPYVPEFVGKGAAVGASTPGVAGVGSGRIEKPSSRKHLCSIKNLIH